MEADVTTQYLTLVYVFYFRQKFRHPPETPPPKTISMRFCKSARPEERQQEVRVQMTFMDLQHVG